MLEILIFEYPSPSTFLLSVEYVNLFCPVVRSRKPRYDISTLLVLKVILEGLQLSLELANATTNITQLMPNLCNIVLNCLRELSVLMSVREHLWLS